MSADARAVKAADKLHNLRTLAAELEAARDRSRVWSRFNAGRERTLTMSRELVDALAPRVEPRLRKALRAAMAEVERLGRDGSVPCPSPVAGKRVARVETSPCPLAGTRSRSSSRPSRPPEAHPRRAATPPRSTRTSG
jgi:hypothetical protein